MKFKRISGSKKLLWGTVSGLVIAGILLFGPLNRMVFSVRLGLCLKKLASGATGEDLDVKRTTIHGRKGSMEYTALLYRAERPDIAGTIVLVPGISELGCYHPRLVAFSRHLASRGFWVITPDIEEFRSFRITAAPIDQILFWYDQAGLLSETQTNGKIGIAGISFSGTLALMAAAKPEIRDRIGFVVAIGPYCSLIRCTRNWFGPSAATIEGEYNHARFYARWIVMLAALEMLSENRDRVCLRNLLKKLLLQEKVPAADDELSQEGMRWYRLATMPPDQSDPELARKIEQYLVARIYPQLDAKDALGDIHCPVYLIHGAYDGLIPPGESLELHQNIPNSHLLLSPFLTHTHPNITALSLNEKARAIFDTLVFCYQFSRAIK